MRKTSIGREYETRIFHSAVHGRGDRRKKGTDGHRHGRRGRPGGGLLRRNSGQTGRISVHGRDDRLQRVAETAAGRRDIFQSVPADVPRRVRRRRRARPAPPLLPPRNVRLFLRQRRRSPQLPRQHKRMPAACPPDNPPRQSVHAHRHQPRRQHKSRPPRFRSRRRNRTAGRRGRARRRRGVQRVRKRMQRRQMHRAESHGRRIRRRTRAQKIHGFSGLVSYISIIFMQSYPAYITIIRRSGR